MFFISIIARVLETETGINLLAGLLITGLFGLQYKKLSEQQKREEMLQHFLND